MKTVPTHSLSLVVALAVLSSLVLPVTARSDQRLINEYLVTSGVTRTGFPHPGFMVLLRTMMDTFGSAPATD